MKTNVLPLSAFEPASRDSAVPESGPTSRVGYILDMSSAPLVRGTFHGRMTNEDWLRFCDEYARWLQRGERFGVVFSALEMKHPDATQRGILASWSVRHAPLLREHCVGTAIVVGSVLLRGALNAILCAAPVPNEHTVAATVADAEAWVWRKLRRTPDLRLERRAG